MSVFRRLLGRPQTRWAETWHSYPGAVGDAQAVWSVDLGAVEVAPVADLPVRLDVEAAYEPGPDGLPADGLALATMEDALRAATEALGGRYVGRVAGGGRCRLTGHLPAEPAEPITLATVPQARVSTAYDPHWAYVRDTLAPDVRQHRFLQDLAVVGELSVHGDPLATPRAVEHVAFFDAQEPAEEAAADLRADGFAASVERDPEGDFALTALRSDPVAPPSVHELTWSVQETVERHGGTYDGWTCAIAA